MGYHRAGFDVTGIDNRPMPRYPFTFHQGDALDYIAKHGHEYDAIHASPPCQRWTHGNVAGDQASKHPDLLTPTRELLAGIGGPYIIENVSRAPMESPITLCGTMFALTATDTDGTKLYLKRHRQFESNLPLMTLACSHPRSVQWAGAYGGARRDKEEARNVRRGGYVPASLVVLRELLGIDWMSETELFQSIPPAYTFFLGTQLLDAMRSAA